jgi:hypothetical protein
LRQRVPKFFDHGHFLEGQRTLEKLPRMQTAPQQKMSLQQSAAIPKNLQNIRLRHRPSKLQPRSDDKNAEA